MSPLRADALAIWQAGVAAVQPATLVRQAIELTPEGLRVAGELWEAQPDSRICVVGGGKAGALMAQGLEEALSPQWLACCEGWINIPDAAGHPLLLLQKVHLHVARPAGVNEPTAAGVLGTQEILKRVNGLRKQDLCLVLISGGGSALLPAPQAGVRLADKLAVTRLLSRLGVTIQQLNAVRSALSDIKGGGLLNACRAGRLVSLIISDVIGDPLEVIASGPTIDPGTMTTRQRRERATQILKSVLGEDRYQTAVPVAIREFLDQESADDESLLRPLPQFTNHILGNNQTAVAAAAKEAQRRGYLVLKQWADLPGIAREVGQELAEQGLQVKHTQRHSVCVLSGGEPTVQVVATDRPQKGGRNQELITAAADRWWAEDVSGLMLLSGGTDGEDGPTEAAGGWVDATVLQHAKARGLHPQDYLPWNNTYPFLEQAGGLLITGPTGTNVMDLRVLLYNPSV